MNDETTQATIRIDIDATESTRGAERVGEQLDRMIRRSTYKPTTPEQRHLVAALLAMDHTRGAIARMTGIDGHRIQRIIDEPETQVLLPYKRAVIAALKVPA